MSRKTTGPSFLTLFAGLLLLLPAMGERETRRPLLDALPAEFVHGVGGNPDLIRLIGADRWSRVVKVSEAVVREGLTAASEEFFLPFDEQRRLILDVRDAKGVPEDLRLVLLDALVQYYVFTYYYDRHDPRSTEFEGEHGAFLGGLGVEFEWVEPAGQNYYRHTFLRRLVQELPDSAWGRFYMPVREATGFDDIPREREGEEAGERSGGPSQAVIEGEVSAGQAFSRPFGPGFMFELRPGGGGWLIVVRCGGRDEDLSRLTPPFHFVPNPRELEGWHFRNSDNTGPNEAGDKNVNAPGEERDFIFSPEIGLSIDPPASATSPSEEDVAAVRAYGHGLLTILEYRLANLEPNARARFDRLRFRVRLAWPAGASGCR